MWSDEPVDEISERRIEVVDVEENDGCESSSVNSRTGGIGDPTDVYGLTLGVSQKPKNKGKN